MNILAFTTRDYYDIVNSKCWDIIECPQLIDFISNLYDGDTVNKDRNVRKFFKEDDEAVGFWEGYRGTFTMRKHKNADVYIIPCIPRNHLYGEGKCKSQKVRQDYIGTFLNCVLSRLKDVNADDIFVAVHDLDVFANNDERNMSDEDLIPDTILSRLIINGSIKRDHIFGFQHDNDNGNLYSLFNQKLGAENLPEDFYTNITKKIIESSEKKTNRGLLEYEGVSSKKIATPRPITPILFTFTIGSNGKFVCTMPDSYNDDCYHEYYILVKAIKEALENKIFESISGDYSTFLLIHHIDDIRGCAKRQEQYVFGQNYFKEDETFFPIIHFCDASLKELEDIFRYSAVIDSSIWNYFTQIDISHESEKIVFKETGQLEYAFKNITFNTNRHIYDLVVARESADLVARFTYNAYIKRFPETEGHGDYVSPFVFHSEQSVNQMIKEEFDETGKTEQILRNKWRILLIDDKSVEKMGTSLKEDIAIDNLPFNCKLTIIKGVLNNRFNKILTKPWNEKMESGKDYEILIEYAQKRKDALNALKTKKYDIILLDYLLDKNIGSKHNYGYQILDDIYNVFDPKASKKTKDIELNSEIKIGSNGRFFFMFTSAYSSAVNERLLAEGLNLSEEYWHISLGACPTNTPQLFSYNLIKLMEKRLYDSGVDKLSAKGVYTIVNSIYGETTGREKGHSVRERANNNYQNVLDLHYLYRKMLRDVQIPSDDNIFNTAGSVLITNFITHNVNIGGFLEHLTQLVHLTAFGTVRQWPEMWEEYIYFKTQFDLVQFENDYAQDKGDRNDAKDLFYKLCEDIESYILNLKSELG